MNKIWLQIFGVMIGGSLIKSAVHIPLVWVCVDIAVLVISYLVLSRQPMIDLKSSMIFLVGLTGVSILTDLGIINDTIGSVIILALLGWMMFGRDGNNNSKPPNLRHKWNK